MSSSMPLARRARLASLALACAVPLAALAQNPQPPAPGQAQQDPDKAAGRQNQKIERIHVEDSGATIDELRVGGQTQNITVKPKSNAPAYQVSPNGAENTRNQGQADSAASDSRVWWNVFKF
jgi:hypothetical protein